MKKKKLQAKTKQWEEEMEAVLDYAAAVTIKVAFLEAKLSGAAMFTYVVYKPYVSVVFENQIGRATCGKNDVWDENKGIAIALLRAMKKALLSPKNDTLVFFSDSRTGSIKNWPRHTAAFIGFMAQRRGRYEALQEIYLDPKIYSLSIHQNGSMNVRMGARKVPSKKPSPDEFVDLYGPFFSLHDEE